MCILCVGRDVHDRPGLSGYCPLASSHQYQVAKLPGSATSPSWEAKWLGQVVPLVWAPRCTAKAALIDRKRVADGHIPAPDVRGRGEGCLPSWRQNQALRIVLS